MHLLHVLVVPPASVLLLAVVGLILWKKRPRLARSLVVSSFALLWVTATPLFGGLLLRSLQVDPPIVPAGELPPAEAIVVLTAGTLRQAPEYGGATVDPVSLERLRYGATLHRRTGAPVLVTGGPADDGVPPVGELMRDVLSFEFDVPVQWVEAASLDTWDNALKSAPLLAEAKVSRIYLVTHAWHMPRAQRCFEAQGLEVVPAPTGFRAPQDLTVASLLPSSKGLRDTAWGCHEWIGRAWYLLRGR